MHIFNSVAKPSASELRSASKAVFENIVVLSSFKKLDEVDISMELTFHESK